MVSPTVTHRMPDARVAREVSDRWLLPSEHVEAASSRSSSSSLYTELGTSFCSKPRWKTSLSRISASKSWSEVPARRALTTDISS